MKQPLKVYRTKEEYESQITGTYEEILVYPEGHPQEGEEYTVKVTVLKDEPNPERNPAWQHVSGSGMH